MKTNMNLCQCEQSNKAFYETFSYNNEHKFGFICISTDQNFVSFLAFDDPDDFTQLTIGEDDFSGFYCELTNLKVGDSMTGYDFCKYIRLW